MNYSNKEDEQEWLETYLMLRGGDETVLSDMTIGKHVILTQKLFNNMIQEINAFRIKHGDVSKGIELIVLEEPNEENNVVDHEG